ncbi:hypothetical protein, partial [Jiella pacifica]|uniref:hypothetical protein n=1 Tax=Jiella pacifica TaxID=2696469 RepID=UPI001940392B
AVEGDTSNRAAAPRRVWPAATSRTILSRKSDETGFPMVRILPRSRESEYASKRNYAIQTSYRTLYHTRRLSITPGNQAFRHQTKTGGPKAARSMHGT